MGDFYNTRDDTGIETDAPIRRRVGIEVELDGTTELAERLINNRLAPKLSEQYDERCDCGDCDLCWEDDDYFFHDCHCGCNAQDDYPIHICADASAPAGEFKIGGSTGVLYGSPAYREAIDTITRNAQACPNIEITDSVGSHVHVDRHGAETDDVAVLAGHFDEELGILAVGDLDELRCNQYMDGMIEYSAIGHDWNETAFRRGVNAPTCEFRFWNSTTDPQLLDMSAGVSAALVEATVAERHERTLLGTIEPFITDAVREIVADKLSTHGQIIAVLSGQQELVAS